MPVKNNAQTDMQQKMMDAPLSQEEVKYDANGGAYNPRNQACSTCRFFIEREQGGYECKVVDHYPAPIVPNGWCEWWTARPTYEPEPLEVVIVEPDEEMEMGEMQRKTVYATPQMNILPKGEGAKTRFIPHRQTIFKDAAGARLMYLVTSNSYEDRDGEFIKSSDLETYVEKEWVADDVFLGTNVHMFWHDPRLEIGDIIWASMEGEFLTEVAKERTGDPVVKAVWDFIEAHPEIQWGTSHGFYYKRRDPDGTYHGVRKFESSTLPLNAAANLLTLSEVIPIMSTKDKMLDQIFNYQGAAKVLREQGVDALRKQLTDAGLVHKDAGGEKSQPVMSPEVAELITDMIVAQDAMQKELDTLKAANKARVSDEALAGHLDKRLERIEKALEMKPTTASSNPQTIVPTPQPNDPTADPDVVKALAELLRKKGAGSGSGDRPFDGMGLYADENPALPQG